MNEFLSWHRPKAGRALVVGSNTYGDKPPRQQLYADAVGVDQVPGDGVDIVHDMQQPLGETFAHVDCCSVLEHCERPWLMAQSIEAALEEGGTLLVMAPFAWRIHAYPSDFWRMSVDALAVLFPSIRWVERVYVANGIVYETPPKLLQGGLKGIQRTETCGFGIKCSAS